MKNILALVLVAMCSGCGMFKPKLSDNYATSALLALKAIEGDPYTPQKNPGLSAAPRKRKLTRQTQQEFQMKRRKSQLHLTAYMLGVCD